MSRTAIAALATVGSLLGGCGDSPRALTWTLDDRPLEGLDVAAFRIEIREGGCEGDAVFSDEAPADGSFSRRPPTLAPGDYGFAAEARDADCRVVGVGCLAEALPLDHPAAVEVRILRSEGAPACEPEDCAAGRCAGDADAGAPDGGTEDAGGTDGCVASDEVCNGRDDDCDGATDETFDLASDPDHCGRCGHACGGGAGGVARCVGGACALECADGRADCDGVAENGCEADLGAAATCGACAVSCSGATPLCGTDDDGSTSCVSGCAPGQTRCGDSCVDTASHPLHCGGCGVVCAPDRASPSCVAGVCGVGACDPGFGDCDRDPADGCETDLRSTLAHCGACDDACAPAHATGACAAGACGVAACDPGFDDCDRDPSDGCETSLTAEPDCGACGVTCGECQTCDGAACGPVPDGAPCGAGACRSGACCAGCWDGSVCRPGTEVTACGEGGAVCAACPCAGDRCEDGLCAPADPVATVTAGRRHTCAILDARERLHCWGLNTRGQLGVGDLELRTRPELVSEGWRSVSGGALHTCGVREGSMYCWGDNREGQLAIGVTGGNRTVPALANSVVGAGSVSAGGSHACGVDLAGVSTGFQCWGNNSVGQLGLGFTGGVVDDETLVRELTDVAFDASDRHTCLIDGFAGRMFCFGSDADGRLGNGPRLGDVDEPTVEVGGRSGDWVTVSAGDRHTCAIQGAGELHCWGYNGDLALGIPGGDLAAPLRVGTASDWRVVSAGAAHTCGARADGTLHCWGDNSDGQLGTGDRTAASAPTAVGSGSVWATVSAGLGHTCALDQLGALYCWGNGTNGQLGRGDTEDALSPARVCF